MAAPRLLTAGEAFEDLVFVGLERLPAPGEEVKTDTFHATIGGGAVITAVAAARLGVSTAILSALSAPAVARLHRERVRVHNLRQPREPHAISAALSTATDRAFVTYNGVNAVLEPRLLDALATTAAASRAPGPHAARTSTPGPGASSGCAGPAHTVSWDFGWSETLALRPELPALMDALDLVFVNELEAPLYAHVNALDDAYPPLRARTCTVIVKLGCARQPLAARRPEGDVVMPAPRVTPVDTTGAGDAFSAGFLAAWLRGARRPRAWPPATPWARPRRAPPAGSTRCRTPVAAGDPPAEGCRTLATPGLPLALEAKTARAKRKTARTRVKRTRVSRRTS